MEIIPLETTISQSLKRGLYDFCIAVNTTVYYESLMRGIPCLRYYDGSFDLMFGYEKDVFETSSDYERTIKNIKGHDIIEYQQIVNSVLKHSIGVGINNYSKILS